MSKLEKEVLHVCKQSDNASRDFEETVNSIFALCPQGEGANLNADDIKAVTMVFDILEEK